MMNEEKDLSLCIQNLEPIEYQGQRVVTFAMIDELHNRPTGTAKRNFAKTQQYFTEGVHFFAVCEYEIRTHKLQRLMHPKTRQLTLLTELGYFGLIRSFRDELARRVQEMLIEGYFRAKALCGKQELGTLGRKLDRILDRLSTLEVMITTQSNQATLVQSTPEPPKSLPTPQVSDRFHDARSLIVGTIKLYGEYSQPERVKVSDLTSGISYNAEFIPYDFLYKKLINKPVFRSRPHPELELRRALEDMEDEGLLDKLPLDHQQYVCSRVTLYQLTEKFHQEFDTSFSS